MKTQYDRIARLLTRKRGATAWEISQVAGSVSCHSRMSELKAKGWTIWRVPVKGKAYGTYHGAAPDACYFDARGSADRWTKTA